MVEGEVVKGIVRALAGVTGVGIERGTTIRARIGMAERVGRDITVGVTEIIKGIAREVMGPLLYRLL